MKTFKESLGLKIKEYRKAKGLTQEKLAEIVNLNQRQMTRIETGENYPSADTLEKICAALEVEPKFLYDFEWQIPNSLAKTGTDAKPVLRLVQKNETVTVKTSSPEVKEEFRLRRRFPADQSEKSMLQCARNMKQPIKVEYFNGKERADIKVYNPDGTIENLLNEEEINTYKVYESVVSKIKEISRSKNKLNFILKSIDALDEKEALEELKILIKGIELTLD